MTNFLSGCLSCFRSPPVNEPHELSPRPVPIGPSQVGGSQQFESIVHQHNQPSASHAPPPAGAPGHAASSGGTPGPSNSGGNVNAFSQSIYDDHRFYHGTTEQNAAAIRREGMFPGAAGGASDAVRQQIAAHPGSLEGFNTFKDASSHNHVTTVKSSATEASARKYAEIAAGADGSPKILRPFLSKQSTGLETDPESNEPDRPDRFLRTSKPIASGDILPSKTGPVAPSSASETFRSDFNTNAARRAAFNINTKIDSPQAAAEKLNEIQTPSESDFQGPHAGQAELDRKNQNFDAALHHVIDGGSADDAIRLHDVSNERDRSILRMREEFRQEL